ncbi:VWA domain-containing protein [Halosquirtibacter xylanolyticus]|uniref:vWA domain-containing protein n=1 Tax=Halosquirtibacter xylanolyticus TaxID=3374599 RepID=UPI003748964C|nr:VWA domain-containing protein [Prolixibacteraceae bacterium]
MRRLPVYLLIDVSYSMDGEPLRAVQHGVETLSSRLCRNPHALETAYLSVLTFANDVQVDVELTELALFQSPTLKTRGMTSLGLGLKELSLQIKNEVKLSTRDQKGDWKPLIFIMTDGSPTDDWKRGLVDFKQVSSGVVVACAAGEGANIDVLKEITPNVVKLTTLDEGTIGEFFKWVSSSIEVSSTKIETTGEEMNDLFELPPPPQGIDLVKH